MSRAPSTGRLRHRIGEVIAVHHLWEAGDRVAVAVSGGLDSVSLLDLLLTTRDWHGGVMSVVTVDHGTRPGSTTDADFVEALAADAGLPCTRANPAVVSSSEEALREARYGIFESLEVEAIALGHHRDDQAETLLTQLLRGAGSRGLGGMRWRRGRYVRPLLDISRAEILQWARHRGLAWREDPTNANPRYLRNRIRSEVLPLLEEIRPGAGTSLARSASNLAADDAYLAQLGERGPPWPLDWIRDTPPALVRRALAARLGSAGLVEAALKIAARGSGALELGAEGRLEVTGAALVLTKRPPQDER